MDNKLRAYVMLDTAELGIKDKLLSETGVVSAEHIMMPFMGYMVEINAADQDGIGEAKIHLTSKYAPTANQFIMVGG